VFSQAAADPTEDIQVTLFKNGASTGKKTTLNKESFAELLKNKRRLYNGKGELVTTLGQAKVAEKLYSGPEIAGTHFQWPTVEVGNKVEVPGVVSPSGKPIILEALSDSPKVFYIHNFMSDEETNYLMASAVNPKNPYKMAPSTAATHKSWSEGGRGNTMSTRTSMNAFDMVSQVALGIKHRAFKLLRLNAYDESMADGIQILRYELGQAYVAHHDYFPTGQSDDYNWDPKKGGSNRWATVFLYLSDVEYGGQTVFPGKAALKNETNAELVRRLGDAPSKERLEELLDKASLDKKRSWEADLIKKCYTQFAVPPRKGDAILFYSQTPDGTLDPNSLHGACPVLSGTKWGANLWVWNACRFGQCDDPLNPAGSLGKNLHDAKL
jgi:prolyl 4-hydroxylase